MKRKIYKLIVLTVAISIILTSFVIASPATSYTWTINSKGRWTKTQDAYLPETTLVELGLDGPEDLFIDQNNILYIVDTGNKRIVKYSIDQEMVIDTISIEAFKKPRGIYVTANGDLYVADSAAESVFRINSEGELTNTYVRPTDTAFGDTSFKPARISVDTKGNMYIIGEGVLNGIIQLSNGGKFLGYFATNKVTLNFLQELQNMFFTDEQMDNIGSRVPITITNTFVDRDNVVYSTTIGTQATDELAKHNTAGKNTFPEEIFVPNDLVDLYVDENGIVYAASLFGAIWVYSNDGLYIHSFGGNHDTEDIAGLFTNLQSIAVDNSGQIWAADSQTSYIQSFVPTEYATLIYSALDHFQNGEYELAEELWLDILQKNQMLRLAHESLGKIYLYTERYEEAMVHLKIANNKYYYSQAFWETRNIWLQNNLTMLIIGLLLLIIFSNVIKFFDKRKKILQPVRDVKSKVLSVKLISDLAFIINFFKHPIDSFYDLKIGKRGSYLSTTLLYFMFFGIYIHSYIGRSFLFRIAPIEDIDFNAVVLGYFGVTLLFVYTNYLVSSIQDGDGTLGDIYKMTVYSLAPMMLSVLSITVFSYVFTYNEEFFIKLIELVSVIWVGINLVLGLQEIHDYRTRTAIKSIILSVGFMLIIAIVVLLVLLMSEQVYDFFEVIVREVIRNVTSL